MMDHASMTEAIRAHKIIKSLISNLGLDLAGLTVLTEVGSSYFIYTPIICSMAGAGKVYAWTRDSRFGKADRIVERCRALIELYGVDDNIEFAVNQRPPGNIADADIITNSGFLRPLDKIFLSNVRKSSAVVPLMYEKWELRDSDIDIAYCTRNGIKVAGTWENHPSLRIFDHCAPLAAKLALNAGYEVFNNNIIVWSDDHFGDVIEQGFKAMGAAKVIKTVDTVVLMENIAECDFIFLCDYDESRVIAGDGGILPMEKIVTLNPAIGIVHLYGRVDNDYLKKLRVNVYPDFSGSASKMTYTLAHVGLRPVLALIAAGLRVGQACHKGEEHQLSQPIVQ